MRAELDAVHGDDTSINSILFADFAVEGVGKQLPAAIRQRILASTPPAGTEQNQLRRLLDRQRFQQDSIEQTKHRRVRPDAESERQDSHQRQSGTALHGSEAEPHVAKKCLDETYSARVAAFFLEL